MEPSKEAIAVRLTRLNRQILGKVTSTGANSYCKKTIDREALLDALTVLYDECNDDPLKKSDELVRAFVDKYRGTLAELRRIRVCLADFDMLQIIGRGQFGEVHMVREKQTSDVYALKTLRKEAAARRALSAADERAVLGAGAGPWLPRLQYAFQDNSNLYLVMELCSGGDLAGLLSRRARPLAERDAAFYVAETAHALRSLHDLGFAHRDLKPHNILLDRCGHVKLADFGSCARLSESGVAAPAAATPDYVAPELLAAADCAARHTVCLDCCRGLAPAPITACDYWSLGVIAFELVTLQRPFSRGEDDSIAQILNNIHKYEQCADPEPPYPEAPAPPSAEWRALTAGLLRVRASRRFHYLDTLQHAALRRVAPHNIRDQVPPWVPTLRGPEDASHFAPVDRERAPADAAPFRTRAPFAGQLPFVGFSFVAPEESEDSWSSGFSSSHDCTAIDLATFKSAEKLAASRGRELASLQAKLAAAEAAAGAAAERARRAAEDEAERVRARLQAEITALTLQNKRLERQIEIDKEERMALERSTQELQLGSKDRNNSDLRNAQAQVSELECERNLLQEQLRSTQARAAELQAEVARAAAAADEARRQQAHYKDILVQAKDLRHRRLTEINVRAIESMAKERALRRQTLSGCEADGREAATRLASAEASAAKEARARDEAEKKAAAAENTVRTLQIELDEAKRDLARVKESDSERRRLSSAYNEELRQTQQQLTQERVKASTLQVQIQELQRTVEEAARRETVLEEQCTRTEARLQQRVEEALARAADALRDDARHREKVATLEQLVRQLEREVGAMESRGRREPLSDTESVGEPEPARAPPPPLPDVLREQLERAEQTLQARLEEMAALRQEARTANLARWRKEREFNDLALEAKSTARELKRLQERIASASEARKTAEQNCSVAQAELASLKPLHEKATKELEEVKSQLQQLQKAHEVAEAEVDRSRNDILKLKCELQYSERRRLRAERQEEAGGQERGQLRDEARDLRARNLQLEQNNKALQEACSMLEEQLNDLEKLADLHEIKHNDLESETTRLRDELSKCRARLAEAERAAGERGACAALATLRQEEAAEQARSGREQLQQLRERLEAREERVSALEAAAAALQADKAALEAALAAAGRRLRALQEESAALRTRAHDHHTRALALHAQLADAQEELAAAREAADGAAAWWRTRELKADATLRQQAKLIDFLQAKVEEAKRKKCSLGNRLFGRSGRRPAAASPPLRRANKELREEVERLRSRLACSNGGGDSSYQTPRRSKSLTSTSAAATPSIDTPDCASQNDTSVELVWSDGTARERVRVRVVDGVLAVARRGGGGGGGELRARLCPAAAATAQLPHNEAQRAFCIKTEPTDNTPGREAAIVCSSVTQRAAYVTQLSARAQRPSELARLKAAPLAALSLARDALALGCSEGLASMRGGVLLQLADGTAVAGAVTALAVSGGRCVLLAGGAALHCAAAALQSALRRAAALAPALPVARLPLPSPSPAHALQAISGPANSDGPTVAIACGQRVFLLRFDAAVAEYKVARCVTVDRAPRALLLTERAAYIAGERPLKLPLPQGALEPFAMDEPVVAAAARQHSPPRALLLLRQEPLELLLCYAECGVFLDERGRRTRSDDVRWTASTQAFAYVAPFLYTAGADTLVITYISEDSFKTPPCTCDDHSSNSSECFTPETYKMTFNELKLLGTAPEGVVISSKDGDEYSVMLIDGMAAFRSIGASIESLDTIVSEKGSSTDLNRHSDAQETSRETSLRDSSQESVQPNTGFLADIRKRAQLLRKKNRKSSTQTPDDVIKAILTTEVGPKRNPTGRMSPASISESSDEDAYEDVESDPPAKTPHDLCAEMFTRQVRFQ